MEVLWRGCHTGWPGPALLRVTCQPPLRCVLHHASILHPAQQLGGASVARELLAPVLATCRVVQQSVHYANNYINSGVSHCD